MAIMKMVEIDGQKLKAEILSRFKTQREADSALGFSSAVSNWVNNNKLPEYAVFLVEAKLGIPLELYKKVDPAEVPDVMNLNGRQCHYCNPNEEIISAIEAEDGRFSASVSIMPSRKLMEVNVWFGSEAICSEDTMIHFCPFCGRQL